MRPSHGRVICFASCFRPHFVQVIHLNPGPQLKDEYLKQAQKVIQDPNILVNVVSRRVKQLKHGSRPLVESLERLNPEDVALREIIEGKITYQLYNADEDKI
jgi:DNA-directed RNA polymerase subunit omega